jgi:hypothetical protein
MSDTCLGWPYRGHRCAPSDYAGLPPSILGGEEGGRGRYSVPERRVGASDTEHASAGRRTEPLAPHHTILGKEERAQAVLVNSRRGEPGVGVGLTLLRGFGGNEMVMTWGQVGAERRKVRVWRAVLMLLVALGIFGVACWMIGAHADQSGHTYAGRRG